MADGVGQLHRQRLLRGLRLIFVELPSSSRRSPGPDLSVGSETTKACPPASTTLVLSPVAMPAGSGFGLVVRATGTPASERYSEDGCDCAQHQRAAPASDDDECGHDASPPGEVGLTAKQGRNQPSHRFGAPRNRASWNPGPNVAVSLPAKEAAAPRTLATRREANCAARLAKCTAGAVSIAFCTMARTAAPGRSPLGAARPSEGQLEVQGEDGARPPDGLRYGRIPDGRFEVVDVLDVQA